MTGADSILFGFEERRRAAVEGEARLLDAEAGEDGRDGLTSRLRGAYERVLAAGDGER